MPVVTYTDAGGVPISFMDVDGVLVPYVASVDQEKNIRALQAAKGRPDDVILANYNKSGTHWLWEMMCMLYNGKAETIPSIKQFNMFECLSVEQMDAMPSPRVLNTHFRFDKFPPDMVSRKTKTVLIHRNPKDVAVSLYNHHIKLTGVYDYNGEWKDYLPSLFLPGRVDCGSCFEYVKDWEKVMKERPDYPIYVVSYEDLQQDCAKELRNLARFLELPVSDDLCTEVAEKCRFANMVVDKKGLEDEFWTKVWKDRKPSYYRKGEVGDWKNWFTVAQSELFDKVMEEKMAGSQIKFTYQL